MLFVILEFFFFFQAEDGIRDLTVTGVQTCALPIFPRPTRARAGRRRHVGSRAAGNPHRRRGREIPRRRLPSRSEEHTSELQSQSNLVCRLLLEKKKNTT